MRDVLSKAAQIQRVIFRADLDDRRGAVCGIGKLLEAHGQWASARSRYP